MASAPAATAFAISPENLIPPSEIIFIFFPFKALWTSIIAEIWGTPIPATIRVVQIDPGPIPTLITSAPELYNLFAASPVAILPTQIGILLFFLTLDKIFKTFSLWPWAVSITIKSTPLSINNFTLFKSSKLVPIAAPTNNFFLLTFSTSLLCFFISKFRCIIPIPPDFAIAIAIEDSVTVSIAEDKKGVFNLIFLVKLKEMSVSDGKIFEKRGRSNTSSKVSASLIASI